MNPQKDQDDQRVRSQCKAIEEIRQAVDNWRSNASQLPKDYNRIIDRLDFLRYSLDSKTQSSRSRDDATWQGQAEFYKHSYEGLARDLIDLGRKWKLLGQGPGGGGDELALQTRKYLEQVKQNDDLRARITGLEGERVGLLQELDTLNRDKSAISIAGAQPQSDQLVLPFRQFRNQEFEEFCSSLSTLSDEATAERKETIAHIKAIVTKRVLLEIWSLRENRSDLPDSKLREILDSLLEELRATKDHTDTSSDRLSLFLNLAGKWNSLVQRLSVSQPPVELIIANECDRFDPSVHQVTPGSHEEGAIVATLFPALLAGGRVFERAIVWVGDETGGK